MLELKEGWSPTSHPAQTVTNLAKGLKDATQHLFGDVAVKGANVEPHGAPTAFLEIVSHGRQPVLLRLKQWAQGD